MKKLSNALIIAMLILNSCADESFLNPSELSNVILPSNGATEYPLEVSIRKAPIAPDGTTAKAKTDIVLTFVDPDPDVDGIGLKAGATTESWAKARGGVLEPTAGDRGREADRCRTGLKTGPGNLSTRP